MNRRQKQKQFKKEHGAKPKQAADKYLVEMDHAMWQIRTSLDRMETRIKKEFE